MSFTYTGLARTVLERQRRAIDGQDPDVYTPSYAEVGLRDLAVYADNGADPQAIRAAGNVIGLDFMLSQLEFINDLLERLGRSQVKFNANSWPEA